MGSSRAVELARAEADEAEREDDATTDEPQPEEDEEAAEVEQPAPAVEPGPLAAGVRDDADVEKMFKAFGREDERHAKRVREIAGADADQLQPCPLCATSTAGFLFPGVALGAPVEIKDAIRLAIGDQAMPEYKPAADAVVCEACDGWGLVLTGSKAPQHKTKPCTACNGVGWKAPIQVPPTQTFGPVSPQNGAQLAGGGNVDQWGRLPHQPRYGQDPQIAGW